MTLLLLALGCSDAPTSSTASPAGGAGRLTLAGAVGTREGESMTVPAETAGELDLAMVGPSGDVTSPSQVLAHFDRPMVALGDLDAANAKVPIRCTPEVGLTGHWAGTSTAVLVPAERLPRATTVTCSVARGTRALNGSTLDEEVSWTFSTQAPSVEIRAGENYWDSDAAFDPKGAITVSVDQPTTVAKLREVLRVTRDADGDEIDVRIEPVVDEQKNPRDDAFLVRGDFAMNTAYTIVVRAGLRGNEGENGSTEDVTAAFHTPGPLAVTSEVHDGMDPADSVSLKFNDEVDPGEIAPLLHVSPTPPGGWSVSTESGAARWVWVSTRFAPRTRYTVTLDAGAKGRYGQALPSGASWTFTTGDEAPFVDAPNTTRFYLASQPTRVPVRYRNVQNAILESRGVDLLAWQTARSRGDDAEKAFLAAQRWRREVLAGSGTDNVTHAAWLDMAPLLRDGFGVVESRLSVEARKPNADGPGDPEEGRLIVTDLAATVKTSAGGPLVWVTTLSGGVPVKGATVSLLHAGTVVWQGTTDGAGLAQGPELLRLQASDDAAAIVVVQKGADATYTDIGRDRISMWSMDVTSWGAEETYPLLTHAFADRGVYRPGDTAHVAVMLREGRPEGLRPPAATTLPWELHDGQDEVILRGDVRSGPTGAASFDVRLPPNAEVGEWYVRVGERTSVPVPIRAYRVPAFRVDAQAPATARAGQSWSVDVKANYLHGAPMRGAQVAWSMWRQAATFAPKGWEAWSFEAPQDPAAGDDAYFDDGWGMQNVAQGEAVTGEGTARIDVPLTGELWSRPSEVWLETTVTDVDGQQVASRARAPVHATEAYVGVRAVDPLAEVGKPYSVDVAVVGLDGAPRAGVDVHLEAHRTTWDNVREKAMDGTWRWVSTPRTELVAQGDLKSGPRSAAWTFTPKDAGTYRVLATPRGKDGVATGPQAGVIAWAYGADASWAQSDEHVLDLLVDKTSYAPGDTAKVLVRAPRPGMRALVTVERDGVMSKEVRTLRTTADVLKFPVTEAWQPNVFVSVVAVDGAGDGTGPDAGRPGAWFGAAKLTVTTESRKLQVEVKPGRTSFGPRDEVRSTVTVHRAGKPVANADVIVWAVDHGVLSLTGYTTPNPFDTFYEERALRVDTADNRGDLYDRARALAKGVTPGGDGGGDGATRNRFVTTPFWSGVVRTDASGRAEVGFTLPDNLTTFRLMAVADDAAAAFGAGDAEIQVRRPLVVRPALPRFIRPGDAIHAGAVVHNDTDKALTVTVKASTQGATVDDGVRTVEVPAHGAREVAFAIHDPTGAEVRYRFAAAVDGAADLQDAVEGRIPVEDVLVTERSGSAGSTTSRAVERIVAPKQARPGVGGLDVRVGATALMGLGARVDELLAYPWSCLEQTGSRIRGRLAALAAGGRIQSGANADALKAGVREELARLARFGNWDGYAYWPEQQTDGYATAYALEVLREAREAGFDVSPDAVERAVEGTQKWVLGDRWSEEDAERAAAELPSRLRGALALARAGARDEAVANRAWERRDDLSRAQKAMLLELLARTWGPKDTRVAQLVTDLEGALGVTATQATVQPTAGYERWSGNESATTALVRALLVARPEHPMLPRLAAGVVASRTGGRWTNTYTTAEGLRALVDYSARFERSTVEAKVQFGGRSLLASKLGLTETARATVPLVDLRGGELIFESVGGGRLYHEATVTWSPRVAPAREEGFSVNRRVTALDGALQPGKVSAGATLLVTVTVVTPQDRDDVVLVDNLPAGLEPLDPDFATTPWYASREGGGSEWVFDRREIHDDRVAWFAEHVPAGVHVLRYRARATTPGSFTLPATTVEAMYDPTVYARTAPLAFTVEERAQP